MEQYGLQKYTILGYPVYKLYPSKLVVHTEIKCNTKSTQ